MNRCKCFIVCLVLFVILGSGCENEVFVNLEPFESQMVLYGMIDPFSDSNMLRVGRVFYGADGIEESIQNPDSLYFNHLDIKAEFTDLQYVFSSCSFLPVETEKSSGFFSDSSYQSWMMGAFPLHAASFFTGQEGFTHLKLQVLSDERNEPVMVIERIFRKPIILQPSRFESQLRLYSTTNRSTLIWDPSEYAEYHEVSFNVYYSELVNGNLEHKEIKWSHTWPILDVDDHKQMFLDGDRFMRNISLRLSNGEEQNVKKLNSVTLGFVSGSEAIKDYFNSYEIAADHNGQPISNVINGLGVVGVYSHEELPGLKLTSQGLDSLTTGRITRHLRFVKYDIGLF